MSTSIYNYSYKMKRELHKKIGFVVLFVLIILVLASLLINFFIYSSLINSDSMNPTLEKYNVVFVSPFATPENPIFKDREIIHRGDLVQLNPTHEKELNFFYKMVDEFCLFFTLQKLSPFTSSVKMSENSLFRRVVGLPGDTVYIEDYVVYVKPKGKTHFLTEFELTEKDYDISVEKMDGVFDPLQNSGEFTLGDGEYFVMCDNRSSGLDSRLWGSLPASEIKGKVLCRFFPVSKIAAF